MMATTEKLRDSLKKVENHSEDKLRTPDSFLTDLESHLTTDESALSFMGIFEELELHELTTELHKFREDNNQRVPIY